MKVNSSKLTIVIQNSNKIETFLIPSVEQGQSQSFRNDHANAVCLVVIHFGEKLPNRAFDFFIGRRVQDKLPIFLFIIVLRQKLVQFGSSVLELRLFIVVQNPLGEQELAETLIELLNGIQISQLNTQERFNDIIGL